jgi:cytochrome c-type biogenesis protein CcmH
MSIGFVAIAGLLTLLAAAAVLLPLLRRSPVATPASGGAPAGAGAPDAPARAAAAVAVVVLLGGGAALYGTWSNWNWPAAVPGAAPGTPAEMTASLARRLEREPNDLEGWLMLGRSFAALGQFPLAVRAYERANRLAPNGNADALTGWAEALTLENEAELTGRAGRLFEQALAIDPESQRALFFGAVAAERRGEYPLALERFRKLLALDPPANVQPVLEEQVAALEAQIAGRPSPAAAGPGAAAGVSAASGAGPVVAAGAAVIRLKVRLGAALVAKVGQGAPLFVFVRAPGGGGPPLAAKRMTTAALPALIELTPADSMIAGRSFAAGDAVDVVARVSLGGAPTGQTGDPFGKLSYQVGRDGEKELVIDQLTP